MWSIIDDTLDRPIHNITPPNLARVSLTVPLISTTDAAGTTTSIHVAHSSLLLDHLQKIYSAHRDIQRVELLRLIWQTDIEENEDPIPILSKMREAYSDLTANSTASSSDSNKDLAVAMIIALPPSYLSLAQTLLLCPTPADSASVITAVSDDVRQRATAESTNAALLAKRAIVQPNKDRTPSTPENKTGKYCSFHKSTTCGVQGSTKPGKHRRYYSTLDRSHFNFTSFRRNWFNLLRYHQDSALLLGWS